MQESWGNPLASGTGGRGLIGWTPPSKLPAHAWIPNNPAESLRRQIPLASDFFKNNMGRWFAVANAQADPGIAALVIMNMGERPAGSSQSNPFYPGHGTSKGIYRMQVARTVFDMVFKRLGGIGPSIPQGRSKPERVRARGGWITEPVIGFGERTGKTYSIAEKGPEMVTPMGRLGDLRGVGRNGGQTVINVYPQPGQSEQAIAAAVSRELSWAAASGAR
jgi:hypothetical protein